MYSKPRLIGFALKLNKKYICTHTHIKIQTYADIYIYTDIYTDI